jgi:hypothetical protein
MAQLPEALADSAADAGSLDKQQCCYKQTNPSSRIAFSLAGDVLLMNDSVSNYFISGLACFLLAHICYIWLFFKYCATSILFRTQTSILFYHRYGLRP